ncbi:hypothetical protein BurJ1DRAFT_0079 [Burkholderiales bacterium JOSHI_001]|nr:hypothetical protein BurJ1DRAFT_0079 [Burkholderiales bacterium JOSHI_001]
MADFRRPGTLGLFDQDVIDTGTMCRWASAAPGPIGLSSRGTSPDIPWQDDNGLQIVLSPVQLAAVFESETLDSAPSLSNRLWGAASVFAGGLELVGAAALLLTPEPTAITKVAGGALGVHGADTASAGLTQVVTGRSTTTLTSKAASSTAESLGADPRTAELIGLGADIAVPLLAGGAGLAKILSVRKGAISLAAEEASGGHTIAKHVGRTEEQLRQRLLTDRRIPVASTFRNLSEAERFIAEALRANREAISSWAKAAAIGERERFIYDAGKAVGFGIVRTMGKAESMTKMLVVLKKVQDQNRIYFVLTAFPML